MIQRYLNRTIFRNGSEMYQNVLFERGVKYINQYETPAYPEITKEKISRITSIQHIWKVGDRFYKLANEYYGDPKDWWLIAQFNNKPTESHVTIGEVILIPTPLQEAYFLFR